MRLKGWLLALASASWLLPLALSQAAAPQPTAPPSEPPASKVVTFRATAENVKSLFGVAPSVAALHPGDILDTNTLDCFGGAIASPTDTLGKVKMENPLTGPFYIEGAQPGDTLVIKFLELTVDGDQGIGLIAPGFGALSSSAFTPMLNHDLPERIWLFPIDKTDSTAIFKASETNFSTKIPLRPFLGCVVHPPSDLGVRLGQLSLQKLELLPIAVEQQAMMPSDLSFQRLA